MRFPDLPFVLVFFLYLIAVEGLGKSRLNCLSLETKGDLKLTLSEYVFGTLCNREGRALRDVRTVQACFKVRECSLGNWILIFTLFIWKFDV